MTGGGTGGKDGRGDENDRRGGPLFVMPDSLLLSCPTVVIGHPGSFLFSSEDGFPLKTCGNDRRGLAGRTGEGGGKDGRGDENDRRGGPLSVMPDSLSLSCPTVVIGHPASFLFPPAPGFPLKMDSGKMDSR